jgi:hypothetical protein
MKLSSWAWAWALSGCLFMGSAMGQGLRQPFSVRPAGFDYNRYLQDDVPSPSDQPAPVVASQMHQAPAPVAAAPIATDACTSCAPSYDTSCSSCGSCNDCGCGLGLGSILGDCCLGDAYSLSSQLFCEGSPWTVGGWTQFGYHNESTGLFNQHPGRFNLHQQWFYLEKALQADECNWDWGFRADIMYGVDAADTQAFGNTVDAAGNARGWDTGWNHGIYGWALPQLYAEVGRGDFSVKVGHFYTLVGYEVVTAPDNFFYSHAFTMYNSEPFTHTGAIATYAVSDNLEVYGGWTLGWDTGFDQFGNGSNFLGGFSATLTDDVTLTYITTIGDFGWRGEDGYMQSVVVDTTLTENLNYVFQSDFLRVDSTGEDNVGINQYLFYTVNDCLALGSRVEWWKTDPLTAGLGSQSVYGATFGANIRPHANFVVRPEIRQQWSPAQDFDDTIFGIDVIATY